MAPGRTQPQVASDNLPTLFLKLETYLTSKLPADNCTDLHSEPICNISLEEVEFLVFIPLNINMYHGKKMYMPRKENGDN